MLPTRFCLPRLPHVLPPCSALKYPRLALSSPSIHTVTPFCACFVMDPFNRLLIDLPSQRPAALRLLCGPRRPPDQPGHRLPAPLPRRRRSRRLPRPPVVGCLSRHSCRRCPRYGTARPRPDGSDSRSGSAGAMRAAQKKDGIGAVGDSGNGWGGGGGGGGGKRVWCTGLS